MKKTNFKSTKRIMLSAMFAITLLFSNDLMARSKQSTHKKQTVQDNSDLMAGNKQSRHKKQTVQDNSNGAKSQQDKQSNIVNNQLGSSQNILLSSGAKKNDLEMNESFPNPQKRIGLVSNNYVLELTNYSKKQKNMIQNPGQDAEERKVPKENMYLKISYTGSHTTFIKDSQDLLRNLKTLPVQEIVMQFLRIQLPKSFIIKINNDSINRIMLSAVFAIALGPQQGNNVAYAMDTNAAFKTMSANTTESLRQKLDKRIENQIQANKLSDSEVDKIQIPPEFQDLKSQESKKRSKSQIKLNENQNSQGQYKKATKYMDLSSNEQNQQYTDASVTKAAPAEAAQISRSRRIIIS